MNFLEKLEALILREIAFSILITAAEQFLYKLTSQVIKLLNISIGILLVVVVKDCKQNAQEYEHQKCYINNEEERRDSVLCKSW